MASERSCWKHQSQQRGKAACIEGLLKMNFALSSSSLFLHSQNEGEKEFSLAKVFYLLKLNSFLCKPVVEERQKSFSDISCFFLVNQRRKNLDCSSKLGVSSPNIWHPHEVATTSRGTRGMVPRGLHMLPWHSAFHIGTGGLCNCHTLLPAH